MNGAAIVFIAFTADWCESCVRMKADFAGDGDLHFIASENSPDAVQYYRILGYPTILAVFEGEEIARKNGYRGKKDLRNWMAGVSKKLGEPKKLSKKQKTAAAERLFNIRGVLSSLSDAFDEIVATAREENANGLAFSALLLQESIQNFESELAGFVLQKLSDE